VHQALAHRHDPQQRGINDETIRQILIEQKRTNRLLQGLLMFGVAVGVGAVLARAWIAFAYGG
jgi:ubiquinone biosynthesis protein